MSDAHDQIDDRRRPAARRRLDDRARVALPRGDAEAGSRADVRGHGARDPARHRTDDRRGAPAVPVRESVPQCGLVRKRTARRLREEADEAIDQVRLSV
ncbi:MAG: hypothetical protein DMF86_00740 [Acidobacteria bacterium]|nr:MAG: hypothetical protein DMF86_00740 [Acidobacteriota bacterium]